MKYVVKEQVIPYKSKLFQQGLEQFQNNMKLVLNLFKKHQIPVFFSTVGVNLKDLKPFKSISSDEHSADEYYQLAQEQLQAQDSIAAYTSFSRARDLDALRFRASKEINEIIRELAKDDDNIYLVNTEEEFNRKSRYSRMRIIAGTRTSYYRRASGDRKLLFGSSSAKPILFFQQKTTNRHFRRSIQLSCFRV